MLWSPPRSSYFLAQNWFFADDRPFGDSVGEHQKARLSPPPGTQDSDSRRLRFFGFLKSAFCLGIAHMDKVVGDHPETHPTLHSGVSFVETSPQSVPSLENADAPLTTGPPFLSLFEPALPLFPLPFGALRAAVGNADTLDAFFVRFLFIGGRVEGCVTRDQAGRASQLLLVRLDRRNQQRRVVRPLLIHLEGSDDLILAFLDLHHFAELGGLARLA